MLFTSLVITTIGIETRRLSLEATSQRVAAASRTT